MVNIVTYQSLYTEFGFIIGFIEHLWLITINTCDTVTDIDALQVTTAHSNSSQFIVFISPSYSPGTDQIGNAASNIFSIVGCVFVATGACLASCYIATAVSPGSTIPTFSRHVTLLPP
jgi:hypothetical protein